MKWRRDETRARECGRVQGGGAVCANASEIIVTDATASWSWHRVRDARRRVAPPTSGISPEYSPQWPWKSDDFLSKTTTQKKKTRIFFYFRSGWRRVRRSVFRSRARAPLVAVRLSKQAVSPDGINVVSLADDILDACGTVYVSWARGVRWIALYTYF